MFLTKKNGHPLHKPKNNEPPKNKKALAGWEDEQEISPPPTQKSSPQTQALGQINAQMNNLLISTTEVSESKAPKKDDKSKLHTYYDWEQLNTRSDIDCEKRLVEDIIQPGGIRIKPNQSSLNQFLKEARSMDTPNIGSLLLSKLEVNYPFQIKAKSLYTIQFLSKKNTQYLQYFKHYAIKIREFPEPQDNAQNYRKIAKSVLAILGQAHQEHPQVEEKQTFVDPGYYQQQPKSEFSVFIQDNSNKIKKTEGKRVIIGPGQAKQAKQKQQNRQQPKSSNLMELNIQFQTNKKQEFILKEQIKQSENSKSKQIDLLQL